MLKVIMLIGVSFLITDGFSQRANETSIYTLAVKDYLANKTANGDSTIVYLEAGDIIRARLKRDSIENLNVVLITPDNQSKIYKSNNNKIIHTKTFPAEIDEKYLKIVFVPYRGSKKGNNYTLLVGDGVNVLYRFDCESQEFILDSIEGWGI